MAHWTEYTAAGAATWPTDFDYQTAAGPYLKAGTQVYNNETYLSFQPNIGIGFHFDNIRIDYALTDLGNQSSGLYSNLFSLRYIFNSASSLLLTRQ